MKRRFLFHLAAACSCCLVPLHAGETAKTAARPNIVFILTDDHSTNALGTNEHDSPIPLPNLHRLGEQGMVFDRSFCCNSICGPSRAAIMTGRHSHMNGYVYNGPKNFDGSQPTYPKMLHEAGYATGYFGKWHLGSTPKGFDKWEILPGQGSYYNPDFTVPKQSGEGTENKKAKGYVTDIITDKSIEWLEQRDKTKPFLLVVGHKAPHRAWCPPQRHLGKVDVSHLPLPESLHDDYVNRPEALKQNRQSIANHMSIYSDLKVIKDLVPEDMRPLIVSKGYNTQLGELKRMNPEQKEEWLTYYKKRTEDLVQGMKSGRLKDEKAFTEWKWRAYMEDYLGCVKAVDDSIGRLVDYLDRNGLSDNTLVVYAGDQSFFLGEHGMFDKRWILEESLRMPLIMKWPGKIVPGARSNGIVQNIDYAPTFCEAAGADTPANMKSFQGTSLMPLFKTGQAPGDWRKSIYYCYYEDGREHNCPRHDGVRTDSHTLARIWATGEWMLFDLKKDPQQMKNVYDDPTYHDDREELKGEYDRLRKHYQVPGNAPGFKGKVQDFDAKWDR